MKVGRKMEMASESLQVEETTCIHRPSEGQLEIRQILILWLKSGVVIENYLWGWKGSSAVKGTHWLLFLRTGVQFPAHT